MSLDQVGSCQVSVTLAWNVAKNRPGLSPVTNQQNLNYRISFIKGTAADQLNELICAVITVGAGQTAQVDIAGARANVVNDAAVPLARCKWLFAKLLTAADVDEQGIAIGSACSGVTLGGGPSPFLFLKAATDRVDLGNGDMILLTRRGAAGMAVTAGTGDQLQVVNGDGAVDAKLLLGLGGADV